MRKLFKIKRYSPYVRGVVGQDIPLTLTDRLRILLSGGIQISLVEASLKNSEHYDEDWRCR